MAIGRQSKALGDQSIAMGGQAKATGNSSIAIGADDLDRVASTTPPVWNATGNNESLNNTAVAKTFKDLTGGYLVNFENNQDGTPGIGKRFTLTESGEAAVSLGAKSTANNLATAVGATSTASGIASVALGVHSTAQGEGALAIGPIAKAKGKGSTAVGINSTADGQFAIAIGSASTSALGVVSSGENAVAIGSSAQATKDNSVALGSYATTDTDATQQSSATLNGLTYGTFAGQVTDPGMQVSVGSVGAERQIKNVGSGEISATSTDAINGSQLYATNAILSNVANSTKNIIGGDVTLDAAGNVTGPFTANGTDYNNIAEAIEGESAAAKTEVKQGKNITVTATADPDDGHAIYTVETADEVEFDKVTVGSVVVDAANNDITGLANTTLGATDFATAGRAATEEQLSSVSDSVANIIGGNVSNVGGSITGPFTANGTDYNNIAEAIEGESAAAKTEVKQGKNITVTATADPDDGHAIYTVETADEVEFDKVTVGSVVVDAANNDITGLANTTLGATDFATAGRAATEEQLSSVSDSVANIIGGNVSNVGGSITGPFTANGTDYNNIAEAIEGESAAAKTEVKQGKNITVTATADPDDGHAIYTVETADEVEFDKVTVGSVVVDAANNDITGLANTTLGATDFATAGRAATEEQLSSVSDSVANIIGGNVSNVGGSITGPFTANGTDYNNIAEAIEGESAAAKTEVKQGKNITVTATADPDDGHAIYTVETADEVEFDKVTVGSVVVDAANNDITGLANTTLGATDFATAGRAATEEQLSSVSDSVANIIGGNVSNVGGSITGPFTANGTDYNNIAEAIEGESAAAKTEVKQGKNITVTATADPDDGHAIYTVETADEVEFDKVTVGSVVVDAANNDITGLANTTLGATDFATAGRAATEEQLSSVSDSVANIIGGNVSNVGGSITGPFTANGTDYNNIAEAIEGESAAAKTEVKQGKNITVTATADPDDGHAIYTVETADEVEFDKVTVGSVVVDAANNDITGLANTTLGATDFATAGRAATEEQLSSVSDSVANIIGGNVSNVGGSITGPFTANGTDYNNIAEAIEGESAAAKTEVKQGKNITVTATADPDDGHAIYTVETADEVEFDKVTVGSVVVDAANNDITGLANTTLGATDFATAGRAATEEQLSSVSDSVANIIGGNVSNVGGSITGPFTANGTDYNNIAEAIEGESAAAKTEVKQGKNITVTATADPDDGHAIYTVETADEVEFDKVTVGSVVVDAANNDITGLANTTLGATDFATAGRAATEEQLSSVSDSVANIIGGNVSNVGGSITGPFTANGTDYNNIAEAIEGESAAAKTEVKQGKNITVTATADPDDGHAIYTVETADEVEFDKVTVGSVVVDAANNDITGLANTTLGATDFATAGRAATEEQLSSVSDSVANIIGGNVSNVGGSITGPFTANGTDYNNIAEAIEGESAAAKTEVKQGKNITVTATADPDDGHAIYTVETADEVEFDKVTVGSVVVDAANNDITGLANTTLGATDFATAGRAATEEQLSSVSDSVANIIGGNVSNVGGSITGPFTANGTDYNNIAEAIEGESAAAKTEVKQGKNITVTATADPDDGHAIYTVETADEVEFDKVTVGSVVVDAANNDITGLANTTLGATDFATAGRAATEEQLSSVSDSVANIIGGNVSNVGGSITGPFTANGTDYNNIAEAIEGESAAAKTEVKQGKNITVTATADPDDGHAIYTVETADEVEFDKVTVGSVVVDAANNDITGLANTTLGATDFATAGRAATEEQLSSVSDSVANIIGGNVSNVGGSITGPFTANGTDYNNIAEAIEGESAAAKTEVKQGKNITVTATADPDDGHAIYTVETADEVEFDKVTVGSVVVDAANNDITGLANTTLGATDFATAGRAATEEQLSSVSDSVANIIGGNVSNVGGSITGPFTANGTDYNNIAEAIEGESAAAKTEVKQGKNITVTATADPDDGHAIYTVETADEVEFDKVTVGSVVVDAANNDITGLANTTLGATDFATAGRAATEEQLSSVSDSVANIIGGNVSNVGGSITGPFTANGTDYNNIAEAIEGESAAAKTEVKQGKNITVTATADPDDGHAIYTVETADEVEFDKVTVGSVVVDAANNDITGLANTTLGATDFATAGRAATEEQLSSVSDSVANIIGGNVSNVGGSITGPFTANGTDYNNIAEAIEGESAAAKTEVKQGKNITVTATADPDDGHAIYTVETADEVEFDKVTVGSVVVDAANNDITGLANTTLGATDFATAGRAATEEQLSSVSDSVANIIGGNVSNVGGSITGPFTANGTDYNNIAEAIEGESAAAKTEVKQGKNITVTATADPDDGHAIYTVETADEVEFDKVTVGSVVVDAANNDITGLANTTLGATDFATAGRAATEEQLSSVSDSVANIIGGNVSNVGGSITGPFTANGTDYNNIAEAIEGESAAAKTEVKQGKNITVTATADPDDGHAIYTVETADEVEFDKVTVGSVVVDAANNDITGLANTTLGATDFATAGRAATEEQLSSVSDSVANIIGGNVSNVGGSITGPFTANGTDYNNIAEAIEGESAAAKTEVKQGKNITVTATADPDDGHAIYTVETADEVEFDKVTVGSVVVDAANNDITGLANTTLGATDFATAGRAATEEQLSSVSDSVANIIGGNVSNVGGSITGPFTANGTDYNNIAEAIEGESAAAKTEVKQGKNITVTATADPDDGHAIYTVETADEVEFDKVTVGSVVVDAANNDITGLANTTLGATDFATAGRAATEEQLSSVSDSVANIIGGNVSNVGGSITGPFTANGTDYNNIAEAIEGESAAAKTEVKQGKNITVTATADPDDGHAIYTVETADEVEFDKVTVGSVVVDAANNDITGLANTTLGAADFATAGRAATEEQLSSVSDSVADIIGGGVTNVGGAVTGPFTANGTNYDNIADAIEGEAAAAKTEVEEGKNISVTSITGKDGQTIYTVATADEVEFDKVTVGNTTITTDGLTIVGGPSITTAGINAGGKKVTNVADGEIAEDSTDAVNGSQLYALGDNITNLFGGNALYVNNQISWSNIGGTGQNTVDDAIRYVNDQAANANQGWKVTTDSGNAATSTVKPGDTVSITGDTASGVTVSNNGNDIKIGLADKVTIGSGSNAVSIDGNAGTIQVGDVHIDGSTGNITAGQVTVNGEAGTVNGLTNTTWNPADIVSGQAATEDQLKQVADNAAQAAAVAKSTVSEGENITVSPTKNADGSTNYQVATKKDVTFDKVTSGSVIADKVTVGKVVIDQAGINAGGNKVTNVADGAISSTSKDAINGSQLHASNTNIYNYLGGGANYETNTGPTYNVGGGSHNNVGDALTALDDRDNQLDNKITNLGDQLQQAFYTTNERIDDVEKRANAGIAAAMALETAPYVAGKWTYAAATSYHGGENAVGVTFRKTADNGRWSLTSGIAAASQGDPSFRIGISGVID
nr:YadA-like family protein [Acinetobacter towneri]